MMIYAHLPAPFPLETWEGVFSLGKKPTVSRLDAHNVPNTCALLIVLFIFQTTCASYRYNL
jgi:hypothetical protein